MSCTFNEARDQILKVFKDVWDPLGYPALYTGTAENGGTEGDTPSTNVWARATIRHADGFQSSLTGPLEVLKRHTRVGTVIVQVFAKAGDGGTAAYDAAQTVANAFEKSKDISVWFRRTRINEVGVRGEYEQVNVLANFQYDDVR